jgi:FixJ family two-component response regulator
VIARQTDLSPRTVEMHRAKLMRKFSAATSSELVHKLVGVSR